MKFRRIDEEITSHIDRLLLEESQRETYDAVEDSLDIVKEDSKEFSKTVDSVIDNIPDDNLNSVVDIVSKKVGSRELSDSQKEELSNELGKDVSALDTISDFLDFWDIGKLCREDPKTARSTISAVLTAVAMVEPTPIVEVLASAIAVLPDKAISIVIGTLLTNPMLMGVKKCIDALKKIQNKNSVKEEINMFEDFETEIDRDEYENYDDDMEIDDGIFIDNSVIKSMNILYGDTSKLEDEYEDEDQLSIMFDDEVDNDDEDKMLDRVDEFDDEFNDSIDESFATAAVALAKTAGPKLVAVIKKLPELLAILDLVKDTYDNLPEDNKVKQKLEQNGAKDVEDTYTVVRNLYDVLSPLMHKTSDNIPVDAE